MKKLLLILLLSVPAFGQGFFYQMPPPALPFATIYVCPTPAIGNPCASPSSIFSNSALSTPIANPYNTGNSGSFSFWAASGQYTIQIGQPYNVQFVVSVGGGGAAAGAILAAPAGSQTVNQPSVGGSTPSSSLYANAIENTFYAEDFNWTQAPSAPTSIAIGSNVVTINAVRGVNAFSASPGIYLGEFTKHWLYLAGTGTPEAVLITATTCTGASTGSCTVTFTAANTHAAGYTLASATAGYQEAVNDAAISARNYFAAFGTFGWGGGTITGRPLDIVTFNAPLSLDWVQTRTGTLTLNGNGATIICNTPAQDCIRVSSGVGTNAQPEVTMLTNFTIVPSSTFGRSANGTSIAIHDASQHTMIWNVQFGLSGSANWFDTLISVDGDQNVDIGWNDFSGPGGGTPMKCDTTFCGAAIIGTTLNSAAFGTIHDNNLSTQCNGNAIDWRSGNGLIIRGNTFQNWPLYPWRYGAGLVDMIDQGGNYYEGPCTNPFLGYAAQTGPQYFGNHVLNELFTSPGIPPTFTQFSNTGATLYTYYIVGINGSSQQTVPMMLGYSSTNGSTNYTMKWPDFGATTYDVLRSGPLASNGTDAAPFGTGNWLVGSGITCVSSVCSFTETFAAASSITVNPAYVPSNASLLWWPSPLLLSNSANSACDRYIGVALPQVNTGLNVGGCYYQAIFIGSGTSGGNCVACNIPSTLTGLRVLNLSAEQNQSSTGTATTGARLFPAAQTTQTLTGYKGILNFASGISASSHDSDYITFNDSNATKTFNTAAHQPAADANDCAVGFDNAPTYLAFRCQNAISMYIGALFNSGTSALSRLTSANQTYTVPLVAKTSLGLTGATSGTSTLTAPAVAGTSTNAITSTNILSLPNGSSTAPMISGTGGTQTGPYFNSTTGLTFANAGTDSMAVSTGVELQANGNVRWMSTTTTPMNNASGDTGVSRDAAAVVDVGNGVSGNTTGRVKAAGYMSVGTTFTSNAGCAETTLTGGATAGKYTSVTAGTCTVIITMGNSATAPNGWSCTATDLTTAADAGNIHQTATTTTTASLNEGTVAASDVIQFSCIGY